MREFFSENNNQSSMMRLLSFISVLTALCIAITVTIYGIAIGDSAVNISGELIYLCFGILGFGFGGKVIQKITEKSN